MAVLGSKSSQTTYICSVCNSSFVGFGSQYIYIYIINTHRHIYIKTCIYIKHLYI